jgi:hypothetical protein
MQIARLFDLGLMRFDLTFSWRCKWGTVAASGQAASLTRVREA